MPAHVRGPKNLPAETATARPERVEITFHVGDAPLKEWVTELAEAAKLNMFIERPAIDADGIRVAKLSPMTAAELSNLRH
ncbi:MAG TPA: hypothetical protein VFZ65_23460 [Planctomycetota bacterium]|nr:hypothetical protein [Planctomycetota bacterium]